MIKRLIRRFLDIGLNKTLWAILFVAALMSLSDNAAYKVRRASSDAELWLALGGLLSFAFLKATALTALWSIVSAWKAKRYRWLKIAAKVLVAAGIAVFVILSIINGVAQMTYEMGISRKLVRIATQTNAAEIREFMPGLMLNIVNVFTSLKTWIIIAVAAALYVGLRRMPARTFNIAVWLPSLIGFGYFSVLIVSTIWGRSDLLITIRTTRSVISVLDAYKTEREYLNSLRPLPDKETLTGEYLADEITLVIGESASRIHLNLYGYPLPTSPRLSAMRDSLAIFSDAVASSTSTAENIPRLITFMPDRPTDREWWEYPSMIDIYNELGYRTAWISNQEHSGIWSNVSSALSTKADVEMYVGGEASEDNLLMEFDEAVIEPYTDFITASPERKFAVVHLMGSHTEYIRRYPPEWSRFDASHTASRPGFPTLDESKAERVAQYDNSLLYTDSLLGVIIDRVAASPRPAILVYLSDHGENVYDDGTTCGRDHTSVKVPLIIYVNRAYRERNPEMTATIFSSVNTPLSTANIIYSILSASGVGYGWYDPAYDALSPAYTTPQRYVEEEPYTP